ncbi:MAG TPA: hypothetical protein VFK05_36665 [Polyangiaceae bacterium]|nr:hypothetical protein [Polyangiaceae bacterium]
MSKETVTKSALIKRANRKLAPSDELRFVRGHNAQQELGQWCVFDTHLGNPGYPRLHTDADLERFGRELGVLKENEVVV